MDKPVNQAKPGLCAGDRIVPQAHRSGSLFLSLWQRSRRTFVLGVLTLLVVLTSSWALAARYAYDSNGRLVATTNDAGQSARYVYDKLGNLLRIERLAANELAIFAFSPVRGGAGRSVTIQGQGFSATSSQNAVSFNGTAASVTSATQTELVTQVPVGATTGPVTVTVGAQTAAGPIDFVVDQNAQPPVITDVTPLIVSAGTAVTVSGERLYPAPDQTQVSLNGRLALSTTITNSQLTFPVPTMTGSGKVTVTTPYGSAVSAQDVIVAPAGIATGDILSAGRLTADGPELALSVTSSTQWAALLIDGIAGAMTSLQFSNLTGSVSYTLYGPNNLSVLSGTVSATNPTVHLPRLTPATYALLLKPSAVPATWKVALEKNKVVTAGNEPLTTQANAAYQSKRFTFTATQGQNLGLGVSELAIVGGSYAYVYVYRLDGSQLTYEYCAVSDGGCDVNLPNMAGGTYSVVVVPNSGTMSFNASLSADVVGALALDTPSTLNLGRRGQNGRLTFVASAGQTVALYVANQSTLPGSRAVYYTVYKPDGGIFQDSCRVT